MLLLRQVAKRDVEPAALKQRVRRLKANLGTRLRGQQVVRPLQRDEGHRELAEGAPAPLSAWYLRRSLEAEPGQPVPSQQQHRVRLLSKQDSNYIRDGCPPQQRL